MIDLREGSLSRLVELLKSQSQTDRLAIAYWRLSFGSWDPILGPKPRLFDELPAYAPRRKWPFNRRRAISQSDYIVATCKAIKSIVGEAAISRAYWVYFIGETEEAWFSHYLRRGWSAIEREAGTDTS